MTNAEIIAELDKIIATLKGEDKTVKWNTSTNLPKVDEPKKMWRVIQEKFFDEERGRSPFDRYILEPSAKAAIDAVIECYEKWQKYCYPPFPEYLKEKML